MASTKLTLASVASTLALIPSVLAGYDAGSQSNIAVYWGQNSYGQQSSQERLSTYCSTSKINIIPLAFMNGIRTPITNFANAGDKCTVYAGTQLLNCPEIEEDIKTCQSLGKTILVSIGGATYTEGGFPDAASAESSAETVWSLFGPDTSAPNRPFRSAVVDGFDFDFEATTQNFVPFATKLRSLMDADTSKKYYLSAAPQCPYPDHAMNDMLNGATSFDFIMIQFYNNYCGVQSFVPGASAQYNFNMDTWDTWAKQTSLNKNAKIFLGVPANSGGGGGYQPASSLAPIIEYSKQFSSFGGVMMWDMSQLYQNSGFLDGVYSALTGSSGGSPSSPGTPAPTSTLTTSTTTITTITTTTTTTTTTTAIPPGTTSVPQWGQCGGIGYTGSTECEPPYTCVKQGDWWSSCR
ncbi:glycoside hydrolase family 18 protein [Durotheca rogersii]|uniref:glycoside hydrolase family 18 protein n=1 Tax=Durotheca rogersii TaxID=419775 RepID=UPI00221FFE10|nr:glycoside hydrolase family 18 protein [Durotheca rogersii]KAI5857367.1 glycoside hydrolase family 18 protein [Durotheca rogersii]